MKGENILKINKEGWDLLVKGCHHYSNSSLPEYGFCLEHNEETLHLIDKINDAKILEIGCASGDSLKYLAKKNASELWGLDISVEQLNKSRNYLSNYDVHLIESAMEEFKGIPNNYFDYIISIFSIGYSSDLEKTVENIVSSLKKGGHFILSWTHPLYDKLKLQGNNVILTSPYSDSSFKEIYKGEDKIKLIQNSFSISCLINLLLSKGLKLEKIIEEKTLLDKSQNEFVSNYWKKEILNLCPSTLILKLKK